MKNEVYTVVNGEDNYGISSFKLFDSEAKAMAHAKVLMDRYQGYSGMKWEAEPIEAVANW